MGALTIFDGLISLASEFISDPDKQAKFQLQAVQSRDKLVTHLLDTKTIPWVDATVKLFTALITFARPVGGLMMTAFGMYAHLKGIDMSAMAHTIFDGAFPAWGASRHASKKQAEDTRREIEKEKVRQR